MQEHARLKRWKASAARHGQRAVEVGTHRLGVHRLTWATLAIAVLVVWKVPQIAALIPCPPRSGAEVALIATAALTACSYFVLWLCIFPVHAIPERLQARANDTWLAQRTAWLDRHVGTKADGALDALRGDGYWGLLLIPAFLVAAKLSWATPLATHLGVLALWLVVRSRLESTLAARFVAAPEDAREAARKLFDRGLTIVLVTNAGGELLWNAQSFLPGDLPYRMYSTWAMLQTVFAVVLAVSTFDALSVLGLPWIRTKVVVILALFTLASSGGEPVGSFEATLPVLSRSRASAQEGQKQAWIDQLLARIDEIPATQPALLVAASGGGSRAALLASLVFEKLRMMPAQVGPGERPRTLADNVLLVSSVSGGSLATAYFLTLDPPTAPATALRASVDPAHSRFVQSMATDFMAPLLRGVINLKQERGASVASFWNERFAWSKTNDAAERAPNRPLVVFNATAVQSGVRVGIGFPALPAGFHRSAIVPADINPKLHITLADAVRLSANFPWGFEYAVLSAAAPTGKGAPIDDQVIDGGVVDNTGLDTLAMVMDALRSQASAATADPKAQAIAASYQRALDELRKRGVLLIEIDAGARPSPPTWPATSFSSLSKPVEALGQAGHRNASILRQHNIAQIRQALDEDEPVPAVVGTVRAGFDCAAEGDVMTAWALDYAAREQIYADFRHVEAPFAHAVELQLDAIERLDDARRASIAKLSLSKDPVATARDLRQRYETYLEQAMEVEAIEHTNARDCDARKRDAIKASTELTLRSGIDDAAYLVTEAQAATEVAVANIPDPDLAKSNDVASAAPPATAANPPPDTNAPVPKSVLGWIYLGNRSNDAWQTKYTNWNGQDRPKQGTIVEVATTANVRAAPPDDRGRLAPVRITLKPRTNLEIVETKDWGGTGLVWARVSTPSVTASATKSATPAPAGRKEQGR